MQQLYRIRTIYFWEVVISIGTISLYQLKTFYNLLKNALKTFSNEEYKDIHYIYDFCNRDARTTISAQFPDSLTIRSVFETQAFAGNRIIVQLVYGAGLYSQCEQQKELREILRQIQILVPVVLFWTSQRSFHDDWICITSSKFFPCGLHSHTKKNWLPGPEVRPCFLYVFWVAE